MFLRKLKIDGKIICSRLYNSWRGMHQRCRAKVGATYYKDYAARGISVCSEWVDFAAFRQWAIANGFAKGLTLDRRDNDGNYEPANCQWATHVEQANNRRPSPHRGEQHCQAKLTEPDVLAIRKSEKNCQRLAKQFGVSIHTIYAIRARNKWTHI